MPKNALCRKEFTNKDLGLQVRTITNEDGSISINAEDTAIGFGWTQVKNGKIYPKWERMNGYLDELGFSPQVGKDDYIPESIFYLLGMKANNETALKYQRWLAFDVIPSIRQHGAYLTSEIRERLKENPDYITELIQRLEDRESEIKELEQANELLARNYNEVKLMWNNCTNDIMEFVQSQLVHKKSSKVRCVEVYNTYHRWSVNNQHSVPRTQKVFEEEIKYWRVQDHPIVKEGNYYIGIEVRKS